MFTLSKRADYALAMLTELVSRGLKARVTLKELSELGMPRAFTGKIASNLVEAGILNSKEGKGGGYGLNYSAEEILVIDVLEVIEGEVLPVNCGGCPMGGECGQTSFMER